MLCDSLSSSSVASPLPSTSKPLQPQRRHLPLPCMQAADTSSQLTVAATPCGQLIKSDHSKNHAGGHVRGALPHMRRG